MSDCHTMKGFGVLLLVTFVLAEPPYPPSGWQPSGERLRLPIRKLKQQAPVPHSVYGPPSTEASVEPADAGYLPPSNEQPANEYGSPQAVDNGFDSEQTENEFGSPQEPDNGYGAPQQPDDGYAPSQQPDNGYGPPGQPDNGYQPDTGYGPPGQPEDGQQQPDNGYGPPGNPDYEAPEGSGQLPVDQGPSERLRQNQFVQQLPQFEPARFRQQSNRLRQPVRQQNFQSQRLQQQNSRPQNFRQQNFRQQTFAPQRNNFQSQNFAPQRNNFQSQNFRQVPQNQVKITKEPIRLVQSVQVRDTFDSFESQKLPKTSPSKFQKQQLYTTKKPDIIATRKITRKAKPARTTTTERAVAEEQGPNIAIATAFSGRYYVLQPDGLLQQVNYKLKNGKLTDGQIVPNLKHEQLAPIKEPIYTFNKDNQLVRIS